MSYSIHVPLPFGLLKIKSRTNLRSAELAGQVPVWRLGEMCFVWIGNRRRELVDKESGQTRERVSLEGALEAVEALQSKTMKPPS